MPGMTWEKGNGFKGEKMFTECEAANLKGLWEGEGGREGKPLSSRC